jgi:hypothetical protein
LNDGMEVRALRPLTMAISVRKDLCSHAMRLIVLPHSGVAVIGSRLGSNAMALAGEESALILLAILPPKEPVTVHVAILKGDNHKFNPA